MIRTDAGCSVSRFAELVGVPRRTYNTIRPHQALDQKPPLNAYLQAQTPQPNPPKTEQES